MLVSIVIPTRNSGEMLKDCLKAIRNQTYKEIEIIVSDGGSTDSTLNIAKGYDCKIVDNPEVLGEPGVYNGMTRAKGDIIIVLAVDNMFEKNDSIERIVAVFKNRKIFAAYSKHNSTPEDSLFTKYMNTFTDPFNHFVYGYAANNRTFNRIYKTIEHNSIYDIYDFSSKENLPILALAQGFAVRKEFVKFRKNKYDDISPIRDLIERNKMMAYVYSVSLIHHTVKNLNHFWRKQRWAANNYFNKKKYGFSSRLDRLTAWQKIRAYIYPFYSISIFFPLIFSILAALRDREIMWLFHPFITFISGLAIWSEYIRMKVGRDGEISRL